MVIHHDFCRRGSEVNGIEQGIVDAEVVEDQVGFEKMLIDGKTGRVGDDAEPRVGDVRGHRINLEVHPQAVLAAVARQRLYLLAANVGDRIPGDDDARHHARAERHDDARAHKGRRHAGRHRVGQKIEIGNRNGYAWRDWGTC